MTATKFNPTTAFDDLEDDINLQTPRGNVNIEAHKARVAPDVFVEKCPKCNGTGRYVGLSSHGYKCFACKGTGKQTFKNSAEDRAKARESAAARKERTRQSNLEQYEAEHPQIAAWWTGSTFEFALSLREFATKNGYLTEGQEKAAYKCVQKFAEAQARRQTDALARAQNAVAVDITPIYASLQRAYGNGVRKPVLRLAHGDTKYEFSRAPDTGRNAGAVYVKAGEAYLGKVVGGKFERSRDCSAADEQAIVDICADPEASALAFGKNFGVCSCCGRTLTNELSISLGIGPICRSKFFG